MRKKIIGFILLVPAIFFSLAALSITPRTLTKIGDAFRSGSSYSVGYAFGSIIGQAILIFVAYYLWKRVIRLTKGRKRQDSIEDIGKS